MAAGSATAVSAADGSYSLRDIPSDTAEVTFVVDGYAVLTTTLEQATELDVVLRPNTLSGRLVDAATGEPVVNAAVMAALAPDTEAVAFVRVSDSADGSFSLEGLPESGVIQIIAPGYLEKVVEITPGGLSNEIALANNAWRQVKNAYIRNNNQWQLIFSTDPPTFGAQSGGFGTVSRTPYVAG